jgi:4-hydroxy-tetrahydrodipicolinate synthase
VLQLAREPGVAGTKDSTGDFIGFSRGVLGHQAEDFAWIQGHDPLDGASLMLGARGIVSGLGNVRMDDYVAMYAAAQARDWEGVKELQRRINALFEIIRVCDGRTIAAIKAALSIEGRCTHWMRIRSMSASAEDLAAVERVLGNL